MAQEIECLVQHVFQDIQGNGHADLEASEIAIRDSVHRLGGSFLEKLLNSDGGGYQGASIDCGKGHRARFVEYRDKGLMTVLSPVVLRRAYYYCKECQVGMVLKDDRLDVVGTSFSPGVRRMMGQVAGKEAFDEGRKDLEVLAGVLVTTKAVERVSEAVGEQIEELNQREHQHIMSGKVLGFVANTKIPQTVCCNRW